MNLILLHSSTEFKKNEIKSLEIINSRGFFNNDFGELAEAISATYSRYHGMSWKKKDMDFEFVSDFEMEIEQKIHRVVLHAQVLGNYKFTTYSIGICGNGSQELIRRFHFDYIHDDGDSKKKGPVSHLQYGGKSGTGFDGKPFYTNNIETWLSEPRLNYPPINIALLLDMAFCEFHNEQTEKIVENPEWRSLIKDNETFILGHYYQVLSSHIQSKRHTKESLVRDLCYGF